MSCCSMLEFAAMASHVTQSITAWLLSISLFANSPVFMYLVWKAFLVAHLAFHFNHFLSSAGGCRKSVVVRALAVVVSVLTPDVVAGHLVVRCSRVRSSFAAFFQILSIVRIRETQDMRQTQKQDARWWKWEHMRLCGLNHTLVTTMGQGWRTSGVSHSAQGSEPVMIPSTMNKESTVYGVAWDQSCGPNLGSTIPTSSNLNKTIHVFSNTTHPVAPSLPTMCSQYSTWLWTVWRYVSPAATANKWLGSMSLCSCKPTLTHHLLYATVATSLFTLMYVQCQDYIN